MTSTGGAIKRVTNYLDGPLRKRRSRLNAQPARDSTEQFFVAGTGRLPKVGDDPQGEQQQESHNVLVEEWESRLQRVR